MTPSSSPRILMLIEQLPPDYTGAGRQLLALAPHLQQRGLTLRILTARYGDKDISEVIENAAVQRLAVRAGRAGQWRFAFRASMWVVRHRSEFDLLHVHGISFAAYTCSLAAMLTRKRSVLKLTMAREESPNTIRAGRGGAIKIAILRLFDRFICTSSALVEEFMDSGMPNEKVVHIPNGVDLDRFAPIPTETRQKNKASLCADLDWPPDARLITFIGGIEKRKGIDRLLEAWPGILNEHSNARLLLIGPTDHSYADAEFIDSIKERLQVENLQDAVHFTGFTDNPERFLQMSDLFVFLSRNEGLPNALIEAQASGVPCVATDLPGITSDVIDNETTGIILQQDDTAAFATAVGRLLCDAQLCADMGAAARKRAMQMFSLPDVAKKVFAAL